MKPPPRTRTKPDRNLKPDPVPQRLGKLACKWQRAEQRKLLNALKRFSRTIGEHGDIDYTFLRKQIHTVVESLKNKVISCASFKLKKRRWEDKKVRKPIEVWTQMASAVAGNLEEPISSAFSQMLIVSSTEPRTLRNCDPPQVRRLPTDGPVGRTIPLRPMRYLPVQGESPGTNTAHPLLILKTPAPTIGTAKKLPALSKVVRVPNSKIPPPQQQPSPTAGTSPAATCSSQTAATFCMPGSAEILAAPPTTPQPASHTVIPVPGQGSLSSSSTAVVKTPGVGSSVIQTTQQMSEQHPTTNSTQKSTLSSLHTPLSSSATSLTLLPSTAPSSLASSSSAVGSCYSTHPMLPLSTPAVAFHARLGHTSKYATKDSPRTFGVKCVVDFERIYRYLSVIHKPNEECHLTPMESAIMLNLLMSLPEELSQLDCNKLNKHLTQVYQCLSSPANSKMAGKMFKDLKDGVSAQTEALSCQDSNRTDSQHNNARTIESSDVMDGGGKKLQPDETESQSSGSNNTSSQSGNADVVGLCPPLNPFIVPLKLLMHR
ncbi:snRNA-activating protein complex subunit 2 isoform X2 [Xiphias gladius]|uniref:snRNA-activating protein complex subunit 2 isoform X2 n=1 Tax=Xiphias gladius TaxID=8245 RepID=UPI001A97ED30|nr:snRNA-activating protein complex subunit 2 isoform X2 [Xiphias gladius]